MNISVNIPSYKRPKVLTLDYLPFCKVWVDHKEYENYVKANPEGSQIISCPEGVQGNLCRIRNYILDREFEAGTDCVIIIDDDMRAIGQWVKGENNYGYNEEILKAEDFLEWAEKYAILCEEFGFKFWGLNCNSDAQSYRQYTPFGTVQYIGGPFQAFLNNPLRYDEKLPLKEDYDMTLQQCNKYRGCLRINAWHYYVKQSIQAGGCATYRNEDRERQQFEALQKKWGSDIVKRDSSDKSHKATKAKRREDYNPIIKIPIKGV